MNTIDEQVAREVLGWSDVTPAGNHSESNWYGVSSYSGRYDYMSKKRNFSPSSKFDHAFKVVAKIAEFPKMVRGVFGEHLGQYTVYEYTPSMISRFALDAVRAWREEETDA